LGDVLYHYRSDGRPIFSAFVVDARYLNQLGQKKGLKKATS
jgi:hypothetical protein